MQQSLLKENRQARKSQPGGTHLSFIRGSYAARYNPSLFYIACVAGAKRGGRAYPFRRLLRRLPIHHFCQKRYPFRIPSVEILYPFHILSLELCIPYNCCLKNDKTRTYGDFFTAVKSFCDLLSSILSCTYQIVMYLSNSILFETLV